MTGSAEKGPSRLDLWGQARERDLARLRKKLVRGGDYVAEVEVQLIEEEGGWAPYLTLEDAEKLDQVQEALRQGNVKAASKLARIFYLTPVSGTGSPVG